MPNWCTNEMFVTAKTPEILDAFMEKAKIVVDGSECPFALNPFFPCPPELDAVVSTTVFSMDPAESERLIRHYNETSWHYSEKDLQKRIQEEKERIAAYQANIDKYGYKDWYDWKIANWGTKWDVYGETYVERLSPYRVKIVFDSAWSPPLEWLKHIAPEFPDISFYMRFQEEGNGFAGTASAYREKFDCETHSSCQCFDYEMEDEEDTPENGKSEAEVFDIQ